MRDQSRKVSKILSQAVRTIGAHSAAQRAFTLYPNVEAVAGRLIVFLTDRFPGRDGPLVHECLRCGFDALSEARAAKKAGEEAQAFLTALVGNAYEAVKKRVGVENGHAGEFWVPFNESFRDFLGRVTQEPETAELVVVDEAVRGGIDESMAAAMLAVRIMSARDADRVCAAYLGRCRKQAA